MSRIPAAPMPLTTTGAIPVTRIVPARPITKAPHQFVFLLRPSVGSVISIEDIVSPLLPFPNLATNSALVAELMSEECQVVLHLPVADHRVPGLELLSLDLGVVVE